MTNRPDAMEALGYYSRPLEIERDELLRDQRFPVTLASGAADVQERFAADLAAYIRANSEQGRASTVILQAGTLDLRRAAQHLNRARIGCGRLVVFLAEEFCDAWGEWVDAGHRFSLRGGFRREFYDVLDPGLRPHPDNIVYPNPLHPGELGARSSSEGGVEACYAALGPGGQFLFNLPPAPEEARSTSYFELPTRLVRLPSEARRAAVLELAVPQDEALPPMGITIGLKEIMQSARVRLYLTRDWQSAVVRQAFYGPVTPGFPASMLQRHPDLQIVLTEEVARRP